MLLIIILVAVSLSAVLPWLGLNTANTLLVTRHNPHKADVIVVLGGESESRVSKAIELYRRGFAPKVLVTGRSDGVLIGRRLVAAGVPEKAIWVETAAESTFENASFSLPILRQWNTRSVLLVTSWFHSRRATSVFNAEAGNIEIVSVPTETVSVEHLHNDKMMHKQVLMEYVKIAGYLVKYGIW